MQVQAKRGTSCRGPADKNVPPESVLWHSSHFWPAATICSELALMVKINKTG